MSVRSGLATQLTSPVTESTFGVAPSLSGALFSAFKSETLELKKTVVEGIGILSGKLYGTAARRVVTNYAAAGGVTMDLPAQHLNQWLYPMFGSYGQTPAALAQDIKSTTVASGSNTGEISTIASWSDPSSGVLDVVSTTGFSASGTISVAASGATTAIVTYTGKTSNTFTGCAYVSGSASGTVSTGGAVTQTEGSYSATHAPGTLEGNSFTLQKGVPSADNGTVEPFTYVGCKISEWEISVQTGEIAQLSVTIDSRNELAGTGNTDPLNVSVPGLATYSAPPGAVFHFRQATLYTGGTCSTSSGVTTVSSPTAAGNVKSCSIKHTVPLDAERFFLGSSGFKSEQLQNALREVSGQFVIEWLSSEAMYDAFAADTPTTLELQFLGPAIGTGPDFSTLTILIPDVYLEGDSPKVGGPEVVTQTVPFTGVDDGTDNVIQATYWTLDSA